jgi:hypothetical protein
LLPPDDDAGDGAMESRAVTVEERPPWRELRSAPVRRSA